MTTVSKAVTMQRSRNDEVIGKIFVALPQDMRQCLICDGFFTTQGAAAHAGTICHPSDSRSDSGSDSGLDGGDHANR